MDLLADAGLKVYRFSIEWARIEPERGAFSSAELLHYRAMIEYALAQGLVPYVTLHHFTVPAWFADRGGFAAPDAVEHFTAYVRTVIPILEGATWVCTINEPNIHAMMVAGKKLAASADEGLVSRGLPFPDTEVRDGLLACHRAAVDLLRSAGFRAGWTIAPQTVQAAEGCEELAEEWGYPRDAWWLERSEGDDWVGVQAYTRTIIGPDGPESPAEGVETTLTGWEYYPRALRESVLLAHRLAPNTPIVVSENGIATADDSRRIDYTTEALTGLLEAIDQGADVRGYLHWSLLDNYEWGSFAPTFGLIAVDRTTFGRTPRPSLAWLGEVATRNGLDA
jgi:beta-glucosidase